MARVGGPGSGKSRADRGQSCFKEQGRPQGQAGRTGQANLRETIQGEHRGFREQDSRDQEAADFQKGQRWASML